VNVLERLLSDEEERVIVNQKRLAVLREGGCGEPKVDEDTMVAWYRTPSQKWLLGMTVHQSLFPDKGAVVVAGGRISVAVMDENGAWMWSINPNMLLHKLRAAVLEIDERLLSLLLELDAGTVDWEKVEYASSVSGRVYRNPDLWNEKGLAMLSDALEIARARRVSRPMKLARTIVALLRECGAEGAPKGATEGEDG
jgi:hypothetical protein